MSISIATLKEAIQIKESILQLEGRLAKILGGSATIDEIPSAPAPARRGRPPGKMSPAARARISAAMKARWAARAAKGKSTAAAPAPAAAAKPGPKKKRALSAEGRAKIVAALKKRWASYKKAKK